MDEIVVDESDFPPCIDIIPLLKTIRGVTVEDKKGPLRLVVTGRTNRSSAVEELKRVQAQAVTQIRHGGALRAPSEFAELAYFLHVLLHVHPEIALQNLATVYTNHYGHQFPISKFVSSRTSLAPALTSFGVVMISASAGRSTVSAKLPIHTTYREILDLLRKNPPPGQEKVEPAPKRRRMMGNIEDDVVDSTLRSLHSLLIDLSEGDESTKIDNVDIPIRDLEEEFELRWKVKFDPLVFGVSSTLHFLKKFPKVFNVINNGLEMVVRPVANPSFEIPLEGSVGSGTSSFLTVRPFTFGAATRLAALCVNAVAESAATNTEFEEKYASYDQVEELIDILVEGKPANDICAVTALQDVIRPDPDRVAAPRTRLHSRAM